MGIINHNVILATTWSADVADKFHDWLEANFADAVYVRTAPRINDYQSFYFPPDGSKEGWEESVDGDFLRDRVVKRLALDNYEDDSSPWDWVEVGFGEYGQKVLRGNCKNMYNDAEYAQ